MTDPADIDTEQAPVLGHSTDVDPGVVTADAADSTGADAAEHTIDTPDELGGTGGQQAGGAG